MGKETFIIAFIDAITGEVEERVMTDEEYAERMKEIQDAKDAE
jgi:hypothetical protein